ncbi:hypothetical protein KPL70_017326 [Citrus sinensis]|nr:hypothetical protein KPL70_017326 [Citrus sinensis]
MISGYSQAGRFNEALEPFGKLESLGVHTDEVTMVVVLAASSGPGALDFGKRINTALAIFYKIPKNLKTVFLSNSMIVGLAQHSLGKTSITIFREIELMGLKPYAVT